MPTIVYKYGLTPHEVPKEAIDELWRANRLWNSLVEYDHQNSESYRNLINSSTPELQALTDRIAEKNEHLVELLDNQRKVRQQSRKRNLSDDGVKQDIAGIKVELKDLRAQAKIERAKAKLVAEPKLEVFFENDKTSITSIVKSSGCIWSNHELIYNAFDVARKKARKENTMLRFKPFLGEGRWGYRVSGGFKFSDVQSGSKALYIASPESAQARHFSRKVLLPFKMRVCDFNNEKLYASFDLVYHRPIPDNALIKSVVVKREAQGDRFKYFALFTLTIPDEIYLHQNEDTVGIDVGFAVVPKGLRVATTWDGKDSIELVIPNKTIDAIHYCEKITADIQDATNFVMPKVQKLCIDWLESIPEEHFMHKRIKYIANRNLAEKPISHHVLRKLYVSLHSLSVNDTDSAIVPEELLIVLTDWYSQYIRLFRESTNLKAKLLRNRDMLYKIWSAGIASKYGRVAIEKLNLKDIAEVKDKDEVLGATIRANRVIASLYSLTLALKDACAKRNSNLAQLDAAYTTSRCSTCGTNNNVGSDRIFACSGCGEVHDQDVNAAKNLYALDVNRIDSMEKLIVKAV